MQKPGWLGNYSYFRARTSPDKEAIFDLDNNVRYTYRELDRRADILANYMAEKMNVKKGDRVAFVSRNRMELFDAYYATGKIGAVLVPYNARLSVDELAQLVVSEKPDVMFYEDVFSKNIEELKTKVRIGHYVVLSGAVDMAELKYETIMDYGNAAPRCCPELTMDDIHFIIHTGGTTGLPKGGLISHGTMLFNSMNEVLTWGLSHVDSAHLLLPLFHTGGWNLLTLPLLHAGGRVITN